MGRKELAVLLQVAVETVKNWDRAGLMPERVLPPPQGILRTFAPVILWRVADLKEWACQHLVGVASPGKALFKRTKRPKGKGSRSLTWVRGRGWVEPTRPEPEPRGARRSTEITPKQLVMLARLEGQLNQLHEIEIEDEEPEPLEEKPAPRRTPRFRPEPEPEPFASNAWGPREAARRYW
jgi:hypothetical protein